MTIKTMTTTKRSQITLNLRDDLIERLKELHKDYMLTGLGIEQEIKRKTGISVLPEGFKDLIHTFDIFVEFLLVEQTNLHATSREIFNKDLK